MGYGSYRAERLGGTKPTPPKVPAAVSDGIVRTFTEIFDLSKAEVDKVSGTSNVVATLPAGLALMAIKVRAGVSLGTATLAFGTAAQPTLFGAAAAYGTTPEVEKEYLPVARKGVILETSAQVIMTTGAANLPAAGTIVVDIIASGKD